MRNYVFMIALMLPLASLADGDTPPTRAAVAIPIDPDVLVMDIDDAAALAEESNTKAAESSAVVTPAVKPTAPETRVIELDAPPVAIVNRTNEFRFVSRRPAQRPAAASETDTESAEE